MSVAEKIITHGELSCAANSSEDVRRSNREELNHILESTSTMTLMPTLASLIIPGKVSKELRPYLIQALAVLPLRPNGVRHTFEFVIRVHPSTIDEPQRPDRSQGPSTSGDKPVTTTISPEALNAASRLLSSPPSSMDAEKYFDGISAQLFALLDGAAGPELSRAAAFIIGSGILGRQRYGAPGTAGWNAFARHMLCDINPSLGQENAEEFKASENNRLDQSSPLIQDLDHKLSSKKIVPSSRISIALRRLKTLTSSHPNPGLTKRLLRGIILPLWALCSWPGVTSTTEEAICKPARDLLRIFLQLANGDQSLSNIIQNVMFTGQPGHWEYTIDKGELSISQSDSRDNQRLMPNLQVIDARISALIELLTSAKDIDGVSTLFVSLCRRWLRTAKKTNESLLINEENTTDFENAEEKLVQVRLMQAMLERLPERLVDDSQQLLILISEVLESYTKKSPKTSTLDLNLKHGEDLAEDDEGQDEVTIAISLLHSILSSNKSRLIDNPTNKSTVESISNSLLTISKTPRRSPEDDSPLQPLAQNLLLLLDIRVGSDLSQPQDKDTAITGPTDKDLEDRKTYNLALNYLTSTDSPPPIRAEGLSLLNSLITSHSRILDIPSTIVLLTSLLQDSEEYIYLHTIRTLLVLSSYHPRLVTQSLLESYTDAGEELSLDSRLRIGESLSQILQHLLSSPNPNTAFITSTSHIYNTLLALAGRRTERPKTQARHDLAQKVQARENKEAEKAWNGPVPPLDEVLGGSQDAQENEILTSIVEGWSSKPNSEDIRIRTSALSILGTAIETNITNVGSAIITTAVDLSLKILTLEAVDPSAALLRRAAVLLIMSLLRAFDRARDEGRRLGFAFAEGEELEEILRVLRYVESTDGDELVKSHTRDVIEGLENLKGKTVLGSVQGMQSIQDLEGGLDRLAGLNVNPDSGFEGNRPRIEEIE